MEEDTIIRSLAYICIRFVAIMANDPFDVDYEHLESHIVGLIARLNLPPSVSTLALFEHTLNILLGTQPTPYNSWPSASTMNGSHAKFVFIVGARGELL